jgi:hypothetical protein
LRWLNWRAPSVADEKKFELQPGAAAMSARPISQSQARALAEQHCRAALGQYAYATASLLREHYLEAQHCWMYFLSDAVVQPADAAPVGRWAHVVSKHGAYAKVHDCSADPQQLAACLQAASDHFSAGDQKV